MNPLEPELKNLFNIQLNTIHQGRLALESPVDLEPRGVVSFGLKLTKGQSYFGIVRSRQQKTMRIVEPRCSLRIRVLLSADELLRTPIRESC